MGFVTRSIPQRGISLPFGLRSPLKRNHARSALIVDSSSPALSLITDLEMLPDENGVEKRPKCVEKYGWRGYNFVRTIKMEFYFVKDFKKRYRFFSSQSIHQIDVNFNKWQKMWEEAVKSENPDKMQTVIRNIEQELSKNKIHKILYR